MKTLLLFTLCAGSLFSQTPRSYTTMPTPCGSQGEVALHIVGVKILPNTCQGDGTWKEQATIDQAVVLPLAQSDVTGLPAALTATEKTANKGTVNGYAGLDGTGKVPGAQLPASGSTTDASQLITGILPFGRLPIGATANTVVVGNDARFSTIAGTGATGTGYAVDVVAVTSYVIPANTHLQGLISNAVCFDGTTGEKLLCKSLLTFANGTQTFQFPADAPFTGRLVVMGVGAGGTSSATLVTAISPSTQTEAQGASTATYTATYTASGLGTVITPSVTGLPLNTSVTFSPTTVVAGGGPTTATVAASGTATVGTSTLTFGGSSGATTGTTATSSLTITAAATATLTSGGVSVYTSPQTLTGATDWFVQTVGSATAGANNWSDRKSGGTIFNAGYTGALPLNQNGAGGTFNWTDGTTTATSSKVNSLEIYQSQSVSFTLNTDATARVLTVFSGAGTGGTSGAQPMSVVAHSSNGAVTDVTIPYSPANGVLGAFVFNYKGSGAAGETLTITVNSGSIYINPILAAGKVI